MSLASLSQFVRKLPAWQRIFISLVVGILSGFLLGPNAKYLQPIGTLFIHAIQMMTIPVVFTAIVCAILSMDDLQKMRRVSMKACLLYACCMMMTSIIGLSLATYLQPGSHFEALNLPAAQIHDTPTLANLLMNIIPANPVQAFVNNNILQIVVFAIFLGIAIQLAGEQAKPVAQCFVAFSQVTMKLTHIVMYFAPIGIFALMAWVTGVFGATALIPLLKLIGTIYLSCIAVFIFFYGGTLYLASIPPAEFFKQIRNPLLMAFSTSSSTATLPITLKTAQENLGISKKLSGFLLPLGTSMNMNGLSVYLSVACIFAANVAGITLSFSQYVTIVFMILVTAMGAGAVPGSTIIVIGAVFNSVGLPLNLIPLIATVDRINDMASTTTNVAGDLYAATLIAKHEGELSLAQPTPANEPL